MVRLTAIRPVLSNALASRASVASTRSMAAGSSKSATSSSSHARSLVGNSVLAFNTTPEFVKYDWEDPLNLNSLLTEEEQAIQWVFRDVGD